MRSRDFQRIYDEFTSYYQDAKMGESEYYDWVKALKLDESKPYERCQESFKWAKNMLNFMMEDAENKYYKVLLGFPIKSMNGNVYKERDLIAAALTLKGKSPSLNHKDEFWFSPRNPRNRWGTITVEGAKYEDGAIEVLIKVPKTAVCPVCNGRKMTELLDNRLIVNVSLEGQCLGDTCEMGVCNGFTFTDPPFTLLTSDVLPGIPLARIKPLESFLPFSQVSNTGEKKKMKIVAKMKEDDYTQHTPDSDANTAVNTKSLTTELPKIATPANSDQEVDKQHDLAKTMTGTPAHTDNTDMTMQAQTASSLHHVAHAEAKIGEPCSPEVKACVDAMIANGESEEKAWAVCKSKFEAKTESTTPEYGGDAPSTGTSPPPKFPYTSPGGPDKNKTPDRSIPDAGSLPSRIRSKVVVGTSPVGDSSVEVGTATVEALEERTNRVKAELKAANAEEKAIKWEQMYRDLYIEDQKTQGKLSQSLQTSESASKARDEAIREMHNREVERDSWQHKYEKQLSLSEEYRVQLEAANTEKARITEKYQQSLTTNLELSKKLTKANEDYLDIAKKQEQTEEALTVARTNAKKTLKLRV